MRFGAHSPGQMKQLESDINYFSGLLVLPPQEISNNPAIVRQLGIISMNTALEIDVFGHVNSTHLFGQRMMNGIGGSGDFAAMHICRFLCALQLLREGQFPRSCPCARTWITTSIPYKLL